MKSIYQIPDYRSIYQAGIGKYQLEEIILHLSLHPDDFPVIYHLMFDADDKIAFRAAWTIEKVSDKWPDWFCNEQTDEIIQYCLSTHHEGIRRLLLSVLRYLPVPEPLPIHLFNSLYDWMLLPSSSIGVQSLSMKLLFKYAKTNADLLQELIIILEQTDPADYTAAFYASRANILKHYK